MWQSECAKPEERGYLIMIEGALITGGIMVRPFLQLGSNHTDESSSCRIG